MKIHTKVLGSAVFLVLAIGCSKDDMWIQAKAPRLGETAFFQDGQAARMPVEGTVPRGSFSEDTLLHEGSEDGKPAERFPFPVDRKILEAGRVNFDIHCMPCHGKLGNGDGIIVQRGYARPRPLYHPEVLAKPVGELYREFVSGVQKTSQAQPDILAGTGYSLDDVVHPVLSRKLKPEERWEVLAWIRVLQFSGSFDYDSLTPDEQLKLGSQTTTRSDVSER
ncbi:MAG: hypothetical protein EDM74_11755 [Armatimonadetes bacterium]|nr:MAG: hypothetical protein EDM74_11755 [Armatimonadota bacterium]